MKQHLPKGSLILILFIFIAVGCKKSVDPEDQNQIIGVVPPQDTTLAALPLAPFPITPLPECQNAPYYGDSILYPQPNNAGDFYVYPTNNQGVSGTYLSWPGGLQMDAKTGAINLTRSETGQRYAVGFVKSGTTDTCMSQLIVAGTAYMDSVYVLSQSNKTAKPYFNANPNVPSPCEVNQGPGCKFDYNNYAHHMGIEIDQKTGFIDLEKTMHKSPFGILPINGTTVYTTIYYKLNDASNNAPQKIQLKMIYYNHLSDVPNATLLTIADNALNTIDNMLISKGPSPRPPFIVIVRAN